MVQRYIFFHNYAHFIAHYSVFTRKMSKFVPQLTSGHPEQILTPQLFISIFMYIIGIAGGTGSGKTTVVRKIMEALKGENVAVIPQDSYYNDNTHLTMEERRQVNYDHPNAFDWELLCQQITDLRQGRAIEQPTYDYITSNRQPETIHIEPCEVIIVEGIMALYRKDLRDLMDLKIYVDTDSDVRLIRNILRDTVERGRTHQMVIDRYLQVLKPMHEEFIEPTKRHADLIIPEGGANQQAIEIMETYIRYRLKAHK